MSVDYRVWLPMLARGLDRAKPNLELETERLLTWARKLAPPSVRKTLYSRRNEIYSTAPHALESSAGGIIRPKRARWLFVPLPGHRVTSGQSGLITFPRDKSLFKRFVLDKRTKQLVAVRVKSVTLRGSRWMDRALEEHRKEAEKRLTDAATKLLTKRDA